MEWHEEEYHPKGQPVPLAIREMMLDAVFSEVHRKIEKENDSKRLNDLID